MRLRVAVSLVAATVLAACSTTPSADTPAPATTAGPEGIPIRLGESAHGTLSVSDPTWGMHGPFDLYRFEATAGVRYLIELSSEDFDSYLVVGRMAGGIFDPLNEDDDSGGSLDARIRFDAPESGTYYLLAQAYSEAGEGSYVLSLDEAAPPTPAVALPISVGATVEGELSESDALLEDEEKNYDLYTFEAEAGERYAIALRSDYFDTYLIVGSGNGFFEEIARDDDGGDETNSRVLLVPEYSGTYSIQATSFDGEFGPYDLSVTRLPPPGPLTIVPIRIGQQLTGTLEESDQIGDDGSYYDVYRFSGSEGQRVTIRMSSDEFDSYLELGEAGEDFYGDYTDDDSGGGLDSRISVPLWRTGEYMIRANSLYPDGTGAYTISVEETPEPGPVDVLPIEIGQTIEGTLEQDDAILDDNTYYDIYTFRATAGTRVSITLRSDDFDSFLAFGRWINDDIEISETDDDSGGGFTGYDSQLQLTIPSTGTWAIQVNTINPFEVGEYTIELDEQSSGTEL